MESAGVRILGIGQVSLRVRDLSQSAAFYRDVLGLRVREGQSEGRRTWICTSDHQESRPSRIVLTEGRAPGDAVIHQHFALEVPTREDVRRVHATAKAEGFSTTDPQMYFGRYQTFLFDPDGYKVEIMASEPAEGE